MYTQRPLAGDCARQASPRLSFGWPISCRFCSHRCPVLHYGVPGPTGFRYCTAPDRWCLSSQFYPDYAPWRLRQLSDGFPSFQWADASANFQQFSEPGDVDFTRESVVYHFRAFAPLSPRLMSWRASTFAGPLGYRSLRMTCRLAQAFPLLPYDYTAVYENTSYPGPRFLKTYFALVSCWDALNGIDVSPCPASFRPAVVQEVGVY